MAQTFHGQEIEEGRLFIGGEFVDAHEKGRIETVSPATEEVLAEVAEAREADINDAVSAARAALKGKWGTMSPARRGQLLYRVAELIEERAERLATLETLDQGKPISESSRVDVPMAAKMFRYFAGWTDKIHGMTLPVAGNFHAYTKREPVGVVGLIIPWNFPLLIASWKLGPALAAGNTIVLKPAEQTPLTALELAKIFRDAGFPPGVVNVVPGYGPSAGAALVNHPDVDKIGFTGSTAVGQEIMRSSADSLKRVSLELGGKSPNILFADANIKNAIYGIIGGIFFNKGELCIAGSRTFIHRSIHEQVMETLVSMTQRRLISDPMNPKTRVGPVVNKKQHDRVMSYIKKGQEEGAKLVAGGEATSVDGKGYFIQPTIFDEVDNSMTIAREEIFGPVLSVIPFDSFDEVIEKANDSLYGLAAGVWTQDVKLAHRASNELQAGTVWVNCYNVFDPAAPFGGFKQSGFGRDLGLAAIEDYTETKTVWINLS